MSETCRNTTPSCPIPQREPGAGARRHAELAEASLRLTQQIALLISESGDVYAPSVRDLARRLSEDSEVIAQSLRAITSTARDGCPTQG